MKLRRMVSGMMALLLVCSLPLSAFADTWYLDKGDISVSATESGQTVSQGETSKTDDAPVITQTAGTTTENTVTIEVAAGAEANVTIQDVNIVISDTPSVDYRGKAAVTIDVADNASANVTLNSVDIDTTRTFGIGDSSSDGYGAAAIQITGNGDVTLELDGENTVQSGATRAGVEKNTIAATSTDPGNGNGKLTITDENGTAGSLESTGGKSGAGIGGGRKGDGSNITIQGSAKVTATGGIGGSGIGGNDGSNITIQGSAEVTATGGEYCPGIGGNDGSNITITGSAEVTAKGGKYGSGIGGGWLGSGSNITVSEDAQVKAQGGVASSIYGAGAAIGHGGTTILVDEALTPIDGDEVSPITGALNEGWIATYAPGTTGLDTADPNTLTYEGKNGVTTSTNVKFVPAKDPTCEDDGNTAGFQTESDQIDIVTIPATDHSFTNYIPDGKATCTADDTKTAYCDHAGCDKKDTIPDPGTMLKHELGKYYTDTPATCKAEGVERRDCANCTYSETRPIDKLKHSFTNYISDNNATCTADGTKTAKCDHCDTTDTIPDPGSKLVRKEAPQTAPLYRVIGQDGKALACKTERSSGVLTITVEVDFATLTGSVSGLKTLRAQGVDTIVFVTGGATSTFAIADLLAQGGDTYALTHDGKTVTFTLGSADIGKILK